MTKFIFVTGGVVSSLGKGITAASLGRLLKNRGLKITIQKFDPYRKILYYFFVLSYSDIKRRNYNEEKNNCPSLPPCNSHLHGSCRLPGKSCCL